MSLFVKTNDKERFPSACSDLCTLNAQSCYVVSKTLAFLHWNVNVCSAWLQNLMRSSVVWRQHKVFKVTVTARRAQTDRRASRHRRESLFWSELVVFVLSLRWVSQQRVQASVFNTTAAAAAAAAASVWSWWQLWLLLLPSSSTTANTAVNPRNRKTRSFSLQEKIDTLSASLNL